MILYNQVKESKKRRIGVMKMFEVGKIYGEDAVKYEVVARTKKTVTVVEVHHFGKFNEKRRNERTVKISNWNGREAILFGSRTVLA